MLGADVAVAELQRLAQRQLEDLLGPGGERRGAGRSRTGQADGLLDLLPDSLQRDAERLERLGRDALTLVDQAQEDVLGADEAVVQQARFLLCEHKHPTSPVCESFEHSTASISSGRNQCTVNELYTPGLLRIGSHPTTGPRLSINWHSRSWPIVL